MKLPRDVSSNQLIRLLRSLGYAPVRQKGSHIRLRYEGPPPHLVTVPAHDRLKVGTLQSVLSEVASRLGIEMHDLVSRLADL